MRSSERRPRNALIESRKGYRSGGVVGNPEVENSARECPSVSITTAVTSAENRLSRSGRQNAARETSSGRCSSAQSDDGKRRA